MILRTGLLVEISGHHQDRDHSGGIALRNALNRVTTRVEEQLITLQPRKYNSDGYTH